MTGDDVTIFCVPWVKAKLRGQIVLARARADGSFDSNGGRVEVRYKPGVGRAYLAGAGNLVRTDHEILPDATCGAAEEPAPPKPKASKAQKTPTDRVAKVALVREGGWLAYTDGACSGNPGPAGLGVVLVGPGGERLEGFEYLGQGTNNVAELTAIQRAAEWAPASVPAVVHTDSQYAIGVLSKGWKAKANQELVARVKASLARRTQWQLVYVPGHAGVALNERADELAREAVRTRSSHLLT